MLAKSVTSQRKPSENSQPLLTLPQKLTLPSPQIEHMHRLVATNYRTGAVNVPARVDVACRISILCVSASFEVDSLDNGFIVESAAK